MSNFSIPAEALAHFRANRPVSALKFWMGAVKQGELAGRLSKSPSRVSEWLGGKARISSSEFAALLAAAESLAHPKAGDAPVALDELLDLVGASDGFLWLREHSRAVDAVKRIGWIQSHRLAQYPALSSRRGDDPPIGICVEVVKLLFARMGRASDSDIEWQRYDKVHEIERDLVSDKIQLLLPAVPVAHRLESYYMNLPELVLPLVGLYVAPVQWKAKFSSVSGDTFASTLIRRGLLASGAEFVVAQGDLADNFLAGFLTADRYRRVVHKVERLEPDLLAQEFVRRRDSRSAELHAIVLLSDAHTLQVTRRYLIEKQQDSNVEEIGAELYLPQYRVGLATGNQMLQAELSRAMEILGTSDRCSILESYVRGVIACNPDLSVSDAVASLGLESSKLLLNGGAVKIAAPE